MLDDLTKEIKAQLYERVKSPLFGAFAFSWVGWNYRGLLATVSDMPFKDRMDFLDSLYPTAMEWLWHCLGGPLLTAVGLLVIYPWPARWIYSYWAKQQKKLKQVQQSIEDETPLTQEEARALRKTSLAQAAELEADIAKQSQLVKELNERLRIAAEDAFRISSERDQFAAIAKKAHEELSQHMAEVFHEEPLAVSPVEGLATVAEEWNETPSGLSPTLNKINPEPSTVPAGYTPAITAEKVFGPAAKEGNKSEERDLSAFHALCKLDGATTKELAKLLNWEVEETDESLLNLVRDGQAVRKDGLWGLSPRGKMFAGVL